jgi:peroxiredoxin
MPKPVRASTLIVVIGLSAAWTGLMVYKQRPALPVAGLLHRSTIDPTVDRGGHSRGIVQVDLLRQIMADRARAAPAGVEQGDKAAHRVSSQSHPLLGRPAPPFELKDSTGEAWKLPEAHASEPVILVFYLGQTCMACVTHLVELDFAISRFRDRGVRVLAVSGDSPQSSRQRLNRYRDFRVPLLSDPDHATALAYGVWKPVSGADKNDGEPLHGTFIVDCDGLVRWAYVGDRPFRDIEAIMSELAHLDRDRGDLDASPEVSR